MSSDSTTARHWPLLGSPAMSGYRARTAVFYVAVGALLLLIVLHGLGTLLPGGLGRQIGHNSESLLFALGFCAVTQFLLPALRSAGRALWPVTVPMAGACFVLGYGLVRSGWAPALVTLNESVVALGLLLLYVALPRPFRFAPLVSAAVLAFIVIGFDTGFVLDQAESLVPALLAPIALDVVDRTILEPEQRDRRALRLAWMVLLVVVAVGLIGAARWARTDLHGPLRLGIDYGQRAAEAYWGWLLVHAYFGLWIGHPRGRSRGRRPIAKGALTS